MTKWTFFGKIHPERAHATLGEPISGEMQQPDFGFEYRFRVIISWAQIIVDLEIIKGEVDLLTLRNTARDCAGTLIDLMSYASGCYLQIEIISAVCRDNDGWQIFGVEIPALVTSNNPLRKRELDSDLIIAVAGNPHAALVLRDFHKAMDDPIGTGFFCYRAIEAMMQSIKTDQTKNDKQAWERLNQTLSLDRSVSEKIKAHADMPRHGKPYSMTDNDRSTVLLMTDEIIRRFLEYIRRDSGPLPVAEFPLLRS